MSITKNNLVVVSRNSQLAQVQVSEIFDQLPHLSYRLIGLDSFGDLNKQISLLDSPPADLFTRELDQILLSSQADLAVHSAKDLPYPLPKGLKLIALTEAFDQTDVLVSKNCQKLLDLPVGAKVGTSSPVRKREILQLRTDLEIVSIRGTIQERIKLVDTGVIDALVVAGCAISRLGLNARVAEVLDFETHPLQGNLAIVAAENSVDLIEIFASIDVCKKYGKVCLVGFGPGNPDYLTLAGLKVLENADIIYYDDLTNEEYLFQFKAACKYVGKRSGQHSMEQNEINRLLLESARKGYRVVRLKGGDPSVFAHGGEEIDYLRSNFVEVDVVPGITTALAVAATCKFSLTHRNVSSSVGFVTGHTDLVELPNTDTLVVYMGANRLQEIASKAILQGRAFETPVLIAQKVASKEESYQTYTLHDLQQNAIPVKTPLLMVIGNVLNVEERNRKVLKTLYTGSLAPSQGLGKLIHQPLIELKKLDTFSISSFLKTMKSFRWILFTSRYTVEFIFESLFAMGMDARVFAEMKIASIGRTTSNALKAKGLIPELEPVNESSTGFLEFVDQVKLPASSIIIPRSVKALPIIPQGLKDRNWEVVTVELYDNFLPKNSEKKNLSLIDQVVFTSPSTVNNFLTVYGNFPKHLNYIFKGSETEKRYEELVQKLANEIE